jgi:hypothetical protein
MAAEVDVTPPLTLNSQVTAVPDLLASDLAGEMVLLNLADGVYYGLDAVGAQIWRSIGQPRAVHDLVDDVVAHYEVDRARCEQDVLVFLTDLAAHGLVAVSAPE